VRAAKFFPAGERGLQPYVRAASYRAFPTADFLRQTNEEVFVVLHIEGRRGVAAFEEISQVEGVDVAFLGPYDLSQSLGIPGMVNSPLVREKMAEIVAAAKGKRLAIGTYLAVSLDAGLLLKAARSVVSRLK